MAGRARRVVLFVGADGGRAAEAAFNAVAGRLGLPWAGVSKAAADVTAADFDSAARVVAAGPAESGLRERFPDRAVEHSADRGAGRDRAGGDGPGDAPPRRADGRRVPNPPPKPEPPKKVLTAKVGRETAGRRGKGVTTVFGLPLSEAELLDLAAKLKQRCGTGGTVKDGRIEIQGGNRDRVMAELEKLGFQVKRAGG